jgi:hypothetical protein
VSGRAVRRFLARPFLVLALVPPVVIHATPAGAATPSLRGDWHLEGIVQSTGSQLGFSNPTTPDSSGNSNTGSVVGATVATGLFNPQGAGYGALRFNPFDGSADFVDIANSSTLSFAGEVTVDAWINAVNFATPPGSDGNILVVSKSAPSPQGQTFGLGVSNVESGPSNICPTAAGPNAYFYVQTANGVAITCSSTAVPVGQWVHLAGRYKPSLGVAQVWVNGQPVGVVGHAVPVGSALTTSLADVRIGDRAWNGYRGSFNGLIDEVRIWSRGAGSAGDGASVAPEIQILADSGQQLMGAGPADTGSDDPKPSAAPLAIPTRLSNVGSDIYTSEFGVVSGGTNPVTFNVWALPSELATKLVDPDNDGNVAEHVDVTTIYNLTFLCPTSASAATAPACTTYPGIAIDANNSGAFESGELRGIQVTAKRPDPTQEGHATLVLHLTDGSNLPVNIIVR